MAFTGIAALFCTKIKAPIGFLIGLLLVLSFIADIVLIGHFMILLIKAQ